MQQVTLDKETAMHIQVHGLSSLQALHEALAEVEPHIPDHASGAFKRRFAGMIAELDIEVLEPIYRAHPELRDGDDGAHPPYPEWV
jgi:hypothetical protein